MKFHMLPPCDPAKRVVTYPDADGAPFTFSAADGRAVDAPEEFVALLVNDGWVGVCRSGPSHARPNGTFDWINVREPGVLFFDLDLRAFIAWDGDVWRDAVTGAVV